MAPQAEIRTPYVGGWHLSIYEGSAKKDAAWLFVQWALGKDMVKRAQLENIATGRASAWNSDEYTAQNQYPELAEVFLEAMTIGDPRWNPPVLSVGGAPSGMERNHVSAVFAKLDVTDRISSPPNFDQFSKNLILGLDKSQFFC